ncbi:MAG: hypothetical protein DA330_02220 [Nitrososphaera sp.]|nr:hypothetical protein [Nitrososphaera sp.]
MTEHDDQANSRTPIIMTSPGRMMRGLIICGVTLAVGAAFIVLNFDAMFSLPPPVARLAATAPPPPPPAAAGVTTITILAGAATQGNPDYDPDDAQVPIGNKVVWVNADTAPHTATSGTGPEDASSGSLFDTSIINGGDKSAEIELKDVKVGDVIPYYCFVHPYMVSQLTIVEAGAAGSTNQSPIEAAITIPPGASIQGNKPYDPAEFEIKKGNTFLVINTDTAPHTVTSGTGSDDPNSGTAFDTGIMMEGDRIEVSTVNLNVGDYDYYCVVHPYMKGKFKVTE